MKTTPIRQSYALSSYSFVHYSTVYNGVSSILGNAADFSSTLLLIYLAKQAALISNDHYYILNSMAGKELVHENNILFFPSK
jgi:hypothetical protein